MPPSFQKTAAPVTKAELDAFEAVVGMPLPPAYRAHLLTTNGGSPEPNRFYDEDGDGVWVPHFYSVAHGDVRVEPTLQTLRTEPNPFLAPHHLPVAYDPGGAQICIDLRDGTVWMLLPDGDTYRLAADFDAFLAGFRDDEDDDWMDD